MTIFRPLLLLSALSLAGCTEDSSPPDGPARPDNEVEVAASDQPVQEPVPAGQTIAPPKVVNPPDPPAPDVKPGACHLQDGKQLPPLRFRAVGTEPFWGARIDGRCVTYSHPDDQAGTRIWTKFSGSDADRSWAGALGGKPFVLRIRTQAGCSDGMSDTRYPIAVALTVGGEERQGCAVPL